MTDDHAPASPIGLVPRDIWNAKCRTTRVSDILSAIERYADVRKPVPLEWVTELRELLQYSQEVK